jgi:sortase A
MRLKNLILIVAALATVVALAGCGSPGQSGSDQQGDQQKEQKAQKQETPDKQVAPEQGTQDSGDKQAAVDPPSNDMMKLTIPKMEMIKDDEIPTGLGTDETLFHDYAGVHIEHTGFPWEEEANVYIAGHRLGFPGTDSSYAFYDLNELEEGDEIYITDSEGRKYTYVVFKKVVATPDNLGVLAPLKGKNIVTLQTCTLPDYVNRLLVRGELEKIEQA